jgi:hypothetical protein
VNKARAIDVWFDEWANYYYRANPFDRDRRSTAESLAPRFEIKEKLDCKPFSTFVEKFRKVMLRENLLPVEVFGLKHKGTGLCVELQPTGDLKGVTCDEEESAQVFIPDSWNRLRSGKFTDDCWEQQVPFKVGLCTAHEPKQQDWSIDTSGEIKRKSESGRTKCVQMDNEGNISMGECAMSHLFEKVHIAPYSHDLYK